MRRADVVALAVMLRSARSVLAFDLHAADRVLSVADASAEALPVPREPVQRRNSRPRGHLLNTLWGYGYRPSPRLFSPDGEARLSSQDPVSSLHRDGPGDCTVSRHFAVPTGLPATRSSGWPARPAPSSRSGGSCATKCDSTPARVAVDGYWRRGVADYSQTEGEPSMHLADTYRAGRHPAIFTPEGQPGVRPVGRQ
jgi:hypothetical protein